MHGKYGFSRSLHICSMFFVSPNAEKKRLNPTQPKQFSVKHVTCNERVGERRDGGTILDRKRAVVGNVFRTETYSSISNNSRWDTKFKKVLLWRTYGYPIRNGRSPKTCGPVSIYRDQHGEYRNNCILQRDPAR